ncbi:MAG: hypothetical protein ACFFDP_01200 [Promethearchaeota archaeon]
MASKEIVDEEKLAESALRKNALIVVLIIWIMSDILALGIQILMPIEFSTLICLAWLAEMLILFGVLTILGGRKFALGATYVLLPRLFLPILIITMFLPLPNPMLTLFQIIALIPIGIILLSIISWKFSKHFSDPQMMEGIGVVGIFMGILWLVVFGILFFFLSSF